MEKIILFAPLIGAIIAGFGWRIIGDKGAQWVTTGLLFLCALLSWIVFLGHDGETHYIHVLDWIQSGTLDTAWAIRLDRLTAIMLIVVTTVSALVHLYSMGYMAHDSQFDEETESYRPRFLCVFKPLYLCHAHAGYRRQSGADVLWLGGRGPGLVPAHRVLLPQAKRQCRRDQGVRREPGGAISASRLGSWHFIS